MNRKASSDGNLVQDEKEEEDTLLFENVNGQDFWSMSDDFICRQHAVYRAKLYIPDETTLSSVLKYVDVMRQTSTTIIGNASEHTLNDY